MKSLILITLLAFSNAFATETPCTPEKVKQEVENQVRMYADYTNIEEGITVAAQNIKIGTVMPFPSNSDQPTHYYVAVSLKVEATTPETNINTENGLSIFWFDATTCENNNTDFNELKPVAL
jgi:hypothetical protein